MLRRKARHIQATWGKHCSELPFSALGQIRKYQLSNCQCQRDEIICGEKTKGSLKYIYDYYLNSADWFLKADDNTYVIIENLQRLMHS